MERLNQSYIKLQYMNSRSRFLTAILFSLFAHSILLILLQPQQQFHRSDEMGVLQVTLPQTANRDQLSSSVDATLPAVKKIEAKSKSSIILPIQMPAILNLPREEDRLISGGLQGQSPPAYRQNQIMNAMQQAQFAQQRELHRIAILAGLANLSAQLRQVVIEKIACTQQVDNTINCTPVQNEKTQTLLKQFFGLAIEAHSLGIAENPVRMDFGSELGVSVTLLP
jgi:hypothetical protein